MADAWEVGIRLSLTNGVSGVLSVIAKDILGLKAPIGEVEKAFSAWGPAAVAAMSLATGSALAAFSLELTKKGAEIQKQVGLLQNLGISTPDINATQANAFRASVAAPGTTIAENMGYTRELSTILGSNEEAQKVLSLVLPDAVAVSRATGLKLDDILRIGTKAAELRGDAINPLTHQLDPDRLVKGFRVMEAAMMVSNGLADPNQFYNVLKQSGPMARMFDDPEKFWGEMLPLMVDTGGMRAGTGYMALGRQMIGGKMSFSTAEHLASLGIIDPKAIHKSGGAVSIDDGAWAGQDLISQGRMMDWINQNYLPALKAHGITSNQDVLAEIMKDFSTQTAVRMGLLFAQNQAQVSRDKSLIHTALGQDWVDNMKGNDLGANWSGFTASLTNLMGTLGGPLVKPAIAGLQAITNAINNFTTYLAGHPLVATMTGYGAVSGSALLSGIGVYSGWKALRGFLGGGSGSSGSSTVADIAADVGAGSKWLLAGAVGRLAGIGYLPTMLADMTSDTPDAAWIKQHDAGIAQNRAAMARWWNNMFGTPTYSGPHDRNPGTHPLSYWNEHGLPARSQGAVQVAPPQVTVNPQIQAVINVNGAVIAAIAQAVVKQVGSLISHPTGAPFASTSNFAPALDGGGNMGSW